MKRFLFTLAAAVALVLGVAALTLWPRSYWHVDMLGMDGRQTIDHWQRGGSGASAGGSLWIEWWLRQNGPAGSRAGSTQWAYSSWPLRSTLLTKSWHGFGYTAMGFDARPAASDGRPLPAQMTYVHRISVPHWFVVTAAALLVALWIRRSVQRRRERRLHANLCPTCGYDLRATPDRCPECGAVAGTQVPIARG